MADEKNTPEQIAALKAQEERAAEEAKWPIFEVEIEGDEVEYVGRPGVNDGEPWTDIARARVQLRAPNAAQAKVRALAANIDEGYHTAKKVTEV